MGRCWWSTKSEVFRAAGRGGTLRRLAREGEHGGRTDLLGLENRETCAQACSQSTPGQAQPPTKCVCYHRMRLRPCQQEGNDEHDPRWARRRGEQAPQPRLPPSLQAQRVEEGQRAEQEGALTVGGEQEEGERRERQQCHGAPCDGPVVVEPHVAV